MRVLLIEGDDATARSIELMLRREGFSVYTTELGDEGIKLGKLSNYDLILVNLHLRDMSGIEVLESLRLAKVQTPIIILSSNVLAESKVNALQLGADDYITKPFRKDELIARIRALLQRCMGHSQSVVTTGKLSVDLNTQTVLVAGERVPLTDREYQMLELLSLRKGVILTKEMFMDHLYGAVDNARTRKIIDVFICQLRKKLTAACSGEDYIETVWGRGYALRDPDEQTVAAG
jgi:two-component system, cell cycle response regulator CtrA